ncbi:hypothetical protein LTS18_000971 [Coniosporium uncinatum]|uniref:Uncharacterized protein n=1 Tax=Coniosporium uncinatum TaxID=93489 RepID=A0ACC3DV08_9PEZI|nr:hypothetical protein LTS18_000971 [Coniosporium uncinatum]
MSLLLRTQVEHNYDLANRQDAGSSGNGFGRERTVPVKSDLFDFPFGCPGQSDGGAGNGEAKAMDVGSA